jgi:hypothetical protein
MWPDTGCFASLHIEDAERAQGMEPGHTALPLATELANTLEGADLSPAQALTERFKCVGNALNGKVCTCHLIIIFL